MKDFWSNVLAGVVATIIGGIILTFLIFAFDEWLFPKKNLTGEWVITTTTLSSGYAPFINVKQEFKLELLQKDNDIIGSGEKVKEINPDKTEIVFNPEKRVRLAVSGSMQRNYIKPSKVYFNIIESGERAPSTTTFFLTFIDADHMKGTFISTVSNCKGDVYLTRDDK